MAGKSANESTHNIHTRFLAAMLPKAIAQKKQIVLSIFREGNPIHDIIHKGRSKLRPDIIITSGIFTKIELAENNSKLIFVFQDGHSFIKGTLSPTLSSLFPLLELEVNDKTVPKHLCAIETTVRKTKERTVNQINLYSSEYNLNKSLIMVLSTSQIDIDHAFHIDFTAKDYNQILVKLDYFSRLVLSKLP